MGLFSMLYDGKKKKLENAKKRYIQILSNRKENMMLYQSGLFDREALAGDWGRLTAEFYMVCIDLKEFGYTEEELGDFMYMTVDNIHIYIENMMREKS